MSLADRTPTPKQRGGVCSVAVLYEQIPEDDAEVLRGWFADPQIEGAAILQRLKDEYNDRHEGHDDGEDCTDKCLPDLVTWGYSSLRRHAAADCKCDRL